MDAHDVHDAHYEQSNQNVVPAETGMSRAQPQKIVAQINHVEGGINLTLQVHVVQNNVVVAKTEEEQQILEMRIRLFSAGRILGFPRLYVEDVLHLEPGAQNWFPFALNATKEMLIPTCTQAWIQCIARGIQVIGEEWREYEGLLPPLPPQPEPAPAPEMKQDSDAKKIDE